MFIPHSQLDQFPYQQEHLRSKSQSSLLPRISQKERTGMKRSNTKLEMERKSRNSDQKIEMKQSPNKLACQKLNMYVIPNVKILVNSYKQRQSSHKTEPQSPNGGLKFLKRVSLQQYESPNGRNHKVGEVTLRSFARSSFKQNTAKKEERTKNIQQNSIFKQQIRLDHLLKTPPSLEAKQKSEPNSNPFNTQLNFSTINQQPKFRRSNLLRDQSQVRFRKIMAFSLDQEFESLNSKLERVIQTSKSYKASFENSKVKFEEFLTQI